MAAKKKKKSTKQACDCHAKMNEALKPHNTQLKPMISLIGTPAPRFYVAVEKLNTKLRAPPVALQANYCPMCGVKQR